MRRFGRGGGGRWCDGLDRGEYRQVKVFDDLLNDLVLKLHNRGFAVKNVN